jgi:hypothetical protein
VEGGTKNVSEEEEREKMIHFRGLSASIFSFFSALLLLTTTSVDSAASATAAAATDAATEGKGIASKKDYHRHTRRCKKSRRAKKYLLVIWTVLIEK